LLLELAIVGAAIARCHQHRFEIPLIEEKEALLRHETPRCKLARECVELADRETRTTFLHDVNGRASRTLVITEGLVIHLEADAVTELARAYAAEPNFKRLIDDN
jgi:hypothetical protein